MQCSLTQKKNEAEEEDEHRYELALISTKTFKEATAENGKVLFAEFRADVTRRSKVVSNVDLYATYYVAVGVPAELTDVEANSVVLEIGYLYVWSKFTQLVSAMSANFVSPLKQLPPSVGGIKISIDDFKVAIDQS